MCTLSLISLAVLMPQSFVELDEPALDAPLSSSNLVAANDTIPDAWGPLIRLRAQDGWFSVPVHATLMPDGRVHFMGYERPVEDPSVASDQRKATFIIDPIPLGSPAPNDHVVTSLTPPLDANALFLPPYFIDDTLFCAGNTLTADGQVFTAGGTRGVIDITTGDTFALGMPYATRFDGTNWTRIPNDMVGIGAAGLERSLVHDPDAVAGWPDSRDFGL